MVKLVSEYKRCHNRSLCCSIKENLISSSKKSAAVAVRETDVGFGGGESFNRNLRLQKPIIDKVGSRNGHGEAANLKPSSLRRNVRVLVINTKVLMRI